MTVQRRRSISIRGPLFWLIARHSSDNEFSMKPPNQSSICCVAWASMFLAASGVCWGPDAGNRSPSVGARPNETKAGICSTSGNTAHRYWLAEAETALAFRVYVPTRYQLYPRLPAIVMLHGRGLDENAPLVAAEGLLTRLSEEHGYVIVSPLGYRPDAGFGQRYPLIVDGKELPGPDERTSRLSELDVVSVVHRVLRDCRIDRTRVFLAGHSMGGLGVWYLGAKYPDMWAGMAVMAAGTIPSSYPFAHLRKLPVAVFQGTEDVLSKTEETRSVIRRLESSGLKPYYQEIAGAAHSPTYDRALPAVFEFFDRQKPKTK